MSSAFRLFNPGDDAPILHRSQLTLRQCYERYILPTQLGGRRADETISTYRTTLKHWERFTDDPPAARIDDAKVAEFFDAMQDSEEFRAANLNKQWKNLRAIFRRIAPRGVSPVGIPRGEHVIDFVPHWELLPEDEPDGREVPLEDVARVYEACRVANWPKRRQVPAPLLWRVVFVLLFTYGLRTKDLFYLRWDNVHSDPACPHPKMRRLSNPHGWLVYTPTKTKRSKPQPLYLPLTEAARAHLDAIRGDRHRIFEVGRRVPDWQAQRRRIHHAAGIAEPYLFKDYRATAATIWDDAAQRKGVGEHVTGHAKRGVNERHYQRWLGRLIRVAPHLPQPEVFREIAADRAQPPCSRQLQLF